MKELWNKTFELFRRHIVLWVPCLSAAVLMLWLGKLEQAEIRWLVRFFATQRSVLGGEVPSAGFAQARHRAMMFTYPSAFLKYLIGVSLFVLALTATKNLVCMILNEQTLDMFGALRSAFDRSRAILLFSLKYIAALAVLGGALVVVGSSPFTTDHIHELSSSKPFIYVYALVGQACLAWLLVPAAIRLLQPPGAATDTTATRKLGTALRLPLRGLHFCWNTVLAKLRAP